MHARHFHSCLCLLLLLITSRVAGQEPQPDVVRDRVPSHFPDEKLDRLRGRVKVIDSRTLEFADGTRILLTLVAPDLELQGRIDGKFYPAGREAAEFLRKAIADRPVAAFTDGKKFWDVYVGDTNLEELLVINGWALAHHSSLEAPEVIAREGKRGLWRGEFVDPEDWRKGKRLPGEK
jgi:endonuclease YncB( thermonuclease family)